MIKRLSNLIIALVIFVIIIGFFSQISRAADEKAPFQAAGDDNQVILRWTWPKNSLTAPDYKIYRQEQGDESWQLLTPQLISKVDTKEKAEVIIEPAILKKYTPLLFPKIPDAKKNPKDFRKMMNHMDEIWGMTMLTADMYPEIADLLGVRYVDHDIVNGKTYYYRLTMVRNNIEIIVSISNPVTPQKKIITPPQGFRCKPADGSVFHIWEAEPRFAAYDLYRSIYEKGTYQKINTAPIVIVSSRNKDGNKQYPEWFYMDKNLENGKTYWYTLQGRDPFGRKSGFTEPVALTPLDKTPPKPPLKFNADVEKNTVTLSWEKNTEEDIAGYNIYRSMNYRTGFKKLNTAPIGRSTRTYLDKNLPIGQNWWYYATTVDKIGNESSRSYTALANVRDYIPPGAPAGVTAKKQSRTILLAWQPNPEKDIKGYRVYQSMKKYAGYYHLLNRDPVKKNAFTTPLPKTATNPYFFRITAVDNAGNESIFSNTIEIQQPDVTPPLPPIFKAVDIKEGEIKLTWHRNKETDLAGYNLYRNETEHPKKQDIKLNQKLIPTVTTSFIDTFNLLDGTQYTYTLEAVDKSGNESRRSGSMKAATYDETPPKPPAYIKTQPMAGEVIQVSWKQPNDDDYIGVILFRSEKKDGPFYPITDMLKETVFLDAKAGQGKTYYYRLIALDRSSNRSEYSKIVMGVVKAVSKP